MNSPIKTNQLRVTIDHPSFDERYDIFAVTTSDQYFKHGAHILDVPLLENRVCAVRFLRGNTFYVMMEHAVGNLEVLKSVLQQDKASDKLTLTKVKSTDLYSDTIIQLLLNNLGSAKSDFLRFNNITGQLYCFHPQWMKHSKKNGQDIIMKVPCLKLNITQQLRLEATVHTFTSILLKNKIKFTKRKFEEYPQYVLSVHHTLRRKLDNDNELAYIERQTENDRTEIPFIDFQSLARFEQSKMGVLWRIVSEFNEQYCGIAQISFDETTSYTALEYDRHASKEDKDRLHLYEPTAVERQSEEMAQDIEEQHLERMAPFTFSKCNIPIGATITFVSQGNSNSGAKCVVKDDKTVEYQGKSTSLSALATELLGSKWGVAGPRYFKYNGEWLNDLRAKAEGRKTSSRLDDVWVIPCNPKYYDIVAAFDNLDVIEWNQSTNTTVGDTVYIYVGEKYKSIMFKCEVIAADQYGNRATDDYPYYKNLEKDPNARYMKLKLVEKYPVGQYPLKALKENGLTSVQGRSKATVQLMKYLVRTTDAEQ